MVKTLSNMIPLGTAAPSFKLLDTRNGEMASLQKFTSQKATMIMFLCNHCPFVKHIQTKLVEIANEYQQKGISFIAICSNDVNTYPQDAPDMMQKEAKEHHYSFPYLYDETQNVAKAYQATCTPDFFLFDSKLHCVYRGRFDASTPGNQVPVTGSDLRQALDAVLTGNPISDDQKPSIGCNIKWK